MGVARDEAAPTGPISPRPRTHRVDIQPARYSCAHSAPRLHGVQDPRKGRRGACGTRRKTRNGPIDLQNEANCHLGLDGAFRSSRCRLPFFIARPGWVRSRASALTANPAAILLLRSCCSNHGAHPRFASFVRQQCANQGLSPSILSVFARRRRRRRCFRFLRPAASGGSKSRLAFSVAIKPRPFIARKEIAFAATKRTPSESTLGALRLLPQLRPFFDRAAAVGGRGRPAWPC